LAITPREKLPCWIPLKHCDMNDHASDQCPSDTNKASDGLLVARP
jgi:hypothetical protein